MDPGLYFGDATNALDSNILLLLGVVRPPFDQVTGLVVGSSASENGYFVIRRESRLPKDHYRIMLRFSPHPTDAASEWRTYTVIDQEKVLN